MKEIKGDAIQVFKNCENHCALIHQVNCQGVMGSGIAKQMREEFPEHYDDYMSSYRQAGLPLGAYIHTTIFDYQPYRRKDIVGICGQWMFQPNKYGKDGKRYTNYAALSEGLLRYLEGNISTDIFLPKYMGCGLGGGDWNIVKEILIDIEIMTRSNLTIVEK